MANENSLRSYRDYDAYDRESRSGQVVAGGNGDPLAELVRIMGRDDAYAEVLKSIARTHGHAAESGHAAEPEGASDVPEGEPVDLPAMELRGAVPLQAGETDWDDLEAELESYERQRQAAGPGDDRSAAAGQGPAHESWDGRRDAELERLLEDEFGRSAAESEPYWDQSRHPDLADEDLDARLARALEGETVGPGFGATAGGLAAGGLAAGGLAAGAAVASWRAGAASSPRAAGEAQASHPQEAAGLYGDEDAFAPPRRRRAGVAAILAVVGLAVAGGGGVLAYRALTGGATVAGEPRVIRANAEPVRVAVQPPQVPTGAVGRPAEGERLVSREERPVTPREQESQVQAPPAAPRVIPLGTASRAPAGTVADPGPPPARPAQDIVAAPAARPAPQTPPGASTAAAPPFAGEAPRRVRTVAVGPDGQPVAAAQPAARPVPPPGGLPLSVVPTQSIQTRPVQVQVTPVQVQPVPAEAPRAEAPAQPVAGLAAAESRTAPAPQPRPVVRLARAEPAGETPARSQPRSGAAPLDLDPQRTASVRPQAPVAAGGTFVQISSHQSEAEARNAFAAAQRRFSMLQGQTPNIRAAEIPGRGTWHRLRVGPFSRADAASFCERYRSAGGSCVLN